MESIQTRQPKAQLMQLCRKLQNKGVSGLSTTRLDAYLRQRLPAEIAAKKLCHCLNILLSDADGIQAEVGKNL